MYDRRQTTMTVVMKTYDKTYDKTMTKNVTKKTLQHASCHCSSVSLRHKLNSEAAVRHSENATHSIR